MAALDKEKKSSRLLASRRYTHDTLNASQEAFTEVLDLGASEIYSQAHLIPSTSLPHSGSSQNGLTHSVSGMPVTKYYYRHKLTKSNLNNEAWFFLNPTGSNSGIGAQLIDANQQTNFISPKYSATSLANATTEDATPGYLAIVYKSTSLNSGSLGGSDIVSTNDYVFDYKTGVLQFNSNSVDPSDSQYVYMSVYQYVGTTARTGLDVSGAVTASAFKGDGSGLTGVSTSDGIFSTTGSFKNTTNDIQVTGSLNVSAGVTASFFKGDGSGLTGLAASYTQAEISGAFGAASASLAARLTAEESAADLTGTISSSQQIADDISGSLGTNATFLRNLTESKVSGSAPFTAAGISGSLGANATFIRNLNATKVSGSLGANATFIRNHTAAKVSGALGPNAGFLRNLTQDKVSGSLGANATFLRNLNATKVSESLGTNGAFIRSLTQVGISGSLGDNADFIRNLTRVKVSGSWKGHLSSSQMAFVGGGVSGSAVSTGSFGRVEVGANSISVGGVDINQTVATNITNLDQTLDEASTPTFAGLTLTGNSKFGNGLTDIIENTGSLRITGSLEVEGVFNIDGGTF